MKSNFLILFLFLGVLPACGRKSSHHRDILHAPDELLVQSPLSLAGEAPRNRDEQAFNRCLTGDSDPRALAACNLPYVDVSQGTREQQVASILASTLVSHDWQIARFKTFLETTRPELVAMLSCVKGVAISGDIRPSFYYPDSAGIYLEASDFAQTPEEAATISAAPDSREQNFDQISLLFFTVDTTNQGLESLLAHELTHACDFKHRAQTGAYLSSELPKAPENAVYHMARWLYFGESDSKAEFEKATPEEIGQSFQDGPVVDIYGYGNQFENLAMVVQDQLTFEFTGNNRIDLLTNNPKDTENLRQFPIYWGMQGKFCQPDLFAMGRAITAKTVPMPITFEKTQADCATAFYAPGTPVYQVLGIAPTPPPLTAGRPDKDSYSSRMSRRTGLSPLDIP